MGKGFGTAALIFGIFCIPFGVVMTLLSTVFSMGGIWSLPLEITSFLSLLGWLVPGLAVIFGLIGIIVDDSKGRAIAGFILGFMGLLILFVIHLIFENLFTPLIP